MRLARAGKLRWRILLLIALGAFPVVGLIVHTAFERRDAAAAQIHQNALMVAMSAAEEYRGLVAETRQLLTVLGYLSVVRNAPDPECDLLLASVMEGGPHVNLGVIGEDGRLLCSALPFDDPLDLSDRAYYRRAVETGEFAAGDFQIGRVTDEATINFASPVPVEDAPPGRVVYAALPLVWLRTLATAATLPTGSTIAVVDPAGTVLARVPDDDDWVGRDISRTSLGEAIRERGGAGTAEGRGLQGDERLYALAPLQPEEAGDPVVVAVGIPHRVAFAPAERGMMRDMALLALVTTFVVVMALWGSEYFVMRHVRSLVVAARRLERGDLSARAPAASEPGELGELGGAFNEMAATLERRAREAEEHLQRISRLNRVQRVLSGINSTILRIREREELLAETCRISVDKGSFPAAWISERSPGDGHVQVTATAGDAKALTDALPETDDDPVSRTLRSGRPVVVNRVDAESGATAWRDILLERGYRSLAALPLRSGGEVVAVLALGSFEPDIFDREEMRLLREVAGDASLGLDIIASEQHIEHIANYDLLTGLANRTLFTERLRLAVEIARRGRHTAAVLILKIDQFGQLTATAGQHVGDAVLEELASYLTDAVREEDTVSRIGSAVFGIVLAELDVPEEVAARADAILEGAPATFEEEDETVFLTYSMGVAIYPHDAEDPGTLERNATLALRTATEDAQTSYAFFSEDLDARARRRHQVEKQLRQALEAGELTLEYQPLVDIRTRRATGVEALLRWRTPGLGEISPAEFIPVAEETGLIGVIGEWIVRTACHQGRVWHERGFDIHVNVNVSARQLTQEGFADRIEQILTEARFDAHALALGVEITESELMENVEETVPAINRLRGMGLDVYIDDFGTGYSSLSYLREIPIDTLKIDTSFVRDIPGDADAVAVVRAIIALARELDLSVIAEGVETEEQLAVLEELGCDSVQGFLFSPPVPPEAIEAFFDQPLAV
jgi:diguanylate cyclase